MIKRAILCALIRLRAATIKEFVARICWLTCAKMRERECPKAATSNQVNKTLTVPEPKDDRMTTENASTDLVEPSIGERRDRIWDDHTLAIGDVDPVIDNARLTVRQHQRGTCVLLQGNRRQTRDELRKERRNVYIGIVPPLEDTSHTEEKPRPSRTSTRSVARRTARRVDSIGPRGVRPREWDGRLEIQNCDRMIAGRL